MRGLTRTAPAKRVMSLRDPVRKMSKTDKDPRSRILLTDSPEEIQTKIKAALTDSEPGISYDPAKRPGVSNLIEILSHVDRHGRSCTEIASDFDSSGGIKALKEQVAKSLCEALAGIRERYFEIVGKGTDYLDDVAEQGAAKARANADVTMRTVRSAVGM